MKKVMLLTLSMVLCFSLGAFGATKLETIQVALNSVSIQVDDKVIGDSSIVYNGTTYVPVAFIARELGSDVKWDGEARRVIIKTGKQVAENVIVNEPVKTGNQNIPRPVSSISSVEKIPTDSIGRPLTEDYFKKQEEKIKKKQQEENEKIEEANTLRKMADSVTSLKLSTQSGLSDGKSFIRSSFKNNSDFTVKSYEMKLYLKNSGGYTGLLWNEDVRPGSSSSEKELDVNFSGRSADIQAVSLSITMTDGKISHTFYHNYMSGDTKID